MPAGECDAAAGWPELDYTPWDNRKTDYGASIKAAMTDYEPMKSLLRRALRETQGMQMINPRFNVPHWFPGLDRRRTGHATNPLPGCLRDVAQVRIGLGKRLAFHAPIIADRTLAKLATGMHLFT